MGTSLFSFLPCGALGLRLPPIVQSGKLKSKARWPRPQRRHLCSAGPGPSLIPWASRAKSLERRHHSRNSYVGSGQPGGRPGQSEARPQPRPLLGPLSPVPATNAHWTRPRSAGVRLSPSRCAPGARTPSAHPASREHLDVRQLHLWKFSSAGSGLPCSGRPLCLEPSQARARPEGS